DPAGGLIVPEDSIAVDLVRHDQGREVGEAFPDYAPAIHHPNYRLPGPEAEIEWGGRVVTSAGDAGNDAEAFLPARYRPEGQLAGESDLVSRQRGRYRHRGHAGVRRCVHSRVRSARCCGWCWCPLRQAPRAASPFRHGYRETRPSRHATATV